MPTFRCHNPKCSTDPHGKLGFDFEAPVSAIVCPKCGAGKTARSAALITKLAVIHFDPPTDIHGIGQNFAVCNPEKPIGKGMRGTGVHDAVTCQACRATELFQSSYAASRLMDGEDFEVEFDAREGRIVPKAG